MSVNTDEPGPSRMKRKNSDPLQGHDETKHLAEDRFIPSSLDGLEKIHEQALDVDSAAELGDYLSAQYEILLRVLSNLPAFDLRRAAQVSKSWQSAARVVRDSRLQFHWLFWRANSEGWNVPPPLAVYSSICEHVFSQPTTCVAFFTKTAIKSFECSSPAVICPVTKDYKSCGRQHPMESYMSMALGPRCEIISMSVSGIIGSSQDLQSTFEVENIRGGVQSMSAALFPNCPGVKIVRFKISRQELMKTFKRPSQEVDLAGQLGLPPDMLIQALVLFSGFRIRGQDLSILLTYLQARQEHRFAVAGGTTEKPDAVEGLAILGDNVCAASIVVPESVTEKDEFVQFVPKIKNCNLPSERAFFFLFTCLGRGQMWYDGEKDVESSIVRKQFPKTPIVGFFGRGEIGIDFLPSFQAQDSASFWQNWKAMCTTAKDSLQSPPRAVKKLNDVSIDHAYSTCLLYLSFNTASSSLPL